MIEHWLTKDAEIQDGGVGDFELIKLPDSCSSGSWSTHYLNKIEQAKVEEIRYKTISKEIIHSLKIAHRNRFTLKIYQQLNELQHFPVKLILAMNDYDTANNSKQRAVAKQKLLNICNDFSKLKNDLETVYSETRFLNQPENFVTDMNHAKHLANMGINFDWMFLYEIPMVEKIRAWFL